MNYKFSNLLGAPYRGGNLLMHGRELLSPVGNRVSQVDLVESTSITLPFENSKQIRTLCLSPDGVLLLSIDAEGRALLINKPRGALLHHLSFKGPVSVAKFSPDGRFVACAVGRVLQVWRAPSLQKSVAPMQQHRTYGGCHAEITAVDWSPDGRWIAVGSKDLTSRVFSLDPIEGYRPPTLAGHKESLVGVFFAGSKVAADAAVAGKPPPALYTVSKDGAVFSWACTRQPHPPSISGAGTPAPAAERSSGGNAGESGRAGEAGQSGALVPVGNGAAAAAAVQDYASGEWSLEEKHFFNKRGAKLSAVDFHRDSGMLVAGFTNGIFDIYQMPDFSEIQALSVSRERITALAWGPRGDWLALGCASLGQLLVWEWRSESYILKQQGHYFDVATCAFSPDGAYLASGADDSKVKLWTLLNGFCFVSFAEHTGPVTGLAFLPSGSALLSASLDGTVRAWDLLRYRAFRTLTSPTPVQFVSLAVDPSGEIACAGTLDTFQVFVWSVKTGRLLDVLAAHEGPVAGLAFSPTQPLLASCSWDKTVRTWDVFSGKGAVEALEHNHDVLALAWRPDGKLLASSTLDGVIHLWDPHEAELQGTIEGRRDIAGGRLATDRRAAGNTASGRAFTSLAFSADGAFLLAGGASKWVCMYDVAERVLLRRFQISSNKSLDGVLDQLNSRGMTDAGPADLLDADDTDDDTELLPPTTAGGVNGAGELPGTGGTRRPAVRSRAVALAPTGRAWAAATTEGLLLYSLDASLVFDPTDLAEDVTPGAVAGALSRRAFLRALLLALRLKDPTLMRHVVMSTPPDEIITVADSLPSAAAPPLLASLAEYLSDSPHLEFLLAWVRALCVRHGPALQDAPAAIRMPVLRSLQRALTRTHDDLAGTCESNLYTLQYLTSGPVAAPEAEATAA